MRALVTTATTVRRIAVRLSPAPRDDGGEREGGGEEGAADHRCERLRDRPGCLVAGRRDDAGEEEHERCCCDCDEDPGYARAPPRYHLDPALPNARVPRKSRLIAPPRPEERLKSRPCPQTGRRCHSHAGRMPPTARGGRRRRWILAAGVGYVPIHRTLTPVHARPHTSAPSTRNIDTAPESSGIPFPSPGAASRWWRTARGGCTSPASSRVSHPRPK